MTAQGLTDSSIPRPCGPVEKTLRTAIESGTSLAASGSSYFEIEFLANSTVGPFRLDLRPLVGERAHQAVVVSEIANELRALPLVEDAIGVPPRVYLKVPLPSLYSLVVDSLRGPGSPELAPLVNPGSTVLVAFSDPNINKPLHLGHLRNNFLGMALATLFSETGHRVERHCIHTDWGIHICQALLAYLKWGGGETPVSANVKGDHVVGKYYVMFHTANTQEKATGNHQERTVLEREAAELLHQLTNGNPFLRQLHDTFVGWANYGIQETYRRIGSRFDAIYYESDHLDGCSEMLDAAIQGGHCVARPDGSAFIDLSDAGFGQVTLRRRDGTPVVYSQWMAVDIERFGGREFDSLLVLLGSEWEAGFSILLQSLNRFGERWATRVEPLYYGMVKLPEGRMKSRQGTGLSGDKLLDQVRDRLSSDYVRCDIPDRADDVSDRLAVSLLKYHFLSGRRARDFLYGEEMLWRKMLPRFISVSELLEPSLDRSATGDFVPGPRGPALLLRALLKLNEFPRAVDQAVTRRDPSVLVRFLDGLTAAATACERTVPSGDPLFQAVSQVLARGLQLLNIKLPPPYWALRGPSRSERERDARTLV